jgi:hypothetical protein
MTIKQKIATKKMVENGGNVSKAMRDAGYSFNTAKNPKKLTDSKGWHSLIDEYLPEDLLLEALNADIRNNIGNRKALLELAFKLRGKLDKDNVNNNLIDFSTLVARQRDKYVD